MRNKLFLILVLVTLCFFSCKEKTPKGIIPENVMKDVLFDFHLAQSMQTPHEGPEQDPEMIMKAFYEKYNISKEIFDTSLAYYTNDMELMNSIYGQIQQRMDEEAGKAGVDLSAVPTHNHYGVTGDTVDIWTSSRLCLLTTSRFNRLSTFSIKADTSYYQHDLFKLELYPHFLQVPDKGLGRNTSAQNGVTVGLMIHYENDSVSASIRTFYTNLQSNMILKADSAHAIKTVTGFFSLHSRESSPVLIDGIRLLKLHTGKRELKVKEEEFPLEDMPELKVEPSLDSLKKGPRLSPQEIRDNKPVERKVRIRKR